MIRTPQPEQPETRQQFHIISEEELFSVLGSNPGGLTAEKALAGRTRYGNNDISRVRKPPVIFQFLGHFKNLLIIILLIAAAISMFVGELINALIIFFIVIASVTMDFFQEYKAEQTADLLRQKILTRATVIRDGKEQDLPIADLVPGDLIRLTAGDIVPADARILTARNFFVNQSSLTGEPFPVEKLPGTANPGTLLTAAENYIFLGTSAVSGMATALVTKTGITTEFGKVAKTLVERPPETEFERGLKQYSYLMSKFVFFLVIFVFFINAMFRHGILESLLFSVALAVGMTPELLPMILSLNLSKGFIAMSKKGAIVKHPESIQNFGSMDVLCTDKTGTLTKNEIALVKHLDTEGNDCESVLLYSFINSFFDTGLKSPLDEAILRFRHIDIDHFRKIDEIPFDFVRKRVSVIVSDKDRNLIVSKGAPEEIFRICTSVDRNGSVEPLIGIVQERLDRIYQAQSAEGFRTLAVCYRSVPADTTKFSIADEKEMILSGFVTFIDPPKETARESIRLLEQSGIELKILTGDNELVTKKICEEIGLVVKGVLTSEDIEHMDAQTLSRSRERYDLFPHDPGAEEPGHDGPENKRSCGWVHGRWDQRCAVNTGGRCWHIG